MFQPKLTLKLNCVIFFSHVDRSVPPFLQHLWHSAVVSSSFHASADKNGSCAWGAHCQVPLVCSLVPSPLLLTPSISGAGPLAGWLAGDGRCWGSFPGRYHLHHHGKCDAVPQPPSPASQAPELGLPAPVDALSQTARSPHHQSNRLLHLSMPGSAGRRWRGAHLDTDELYRPKERVCWEKDTAGIWQPSLGLPGWEQTRGTGA